MRGIPSFLGAGLSVLALASTASAAGLSFGAIGPNQKVRPMDLPKTAPSYALKAARNEFESFQIVLAAQGADVAEVSLALSKPLAGPAGSIPAENVVLYREAYYDVGTASNTEGAPGLWPDPLVPAKDVFFGETRNAFPLTVTAGESRVVLVDVLVPPDAAPGDYSGEIAVTVAGAPQGTVPFSLHVGTFSLPSTASLASMFAMGWSDPCLAHTGDNYCNAQGDDVADKLRALYVRSALENRFTIGVLDFQPPIYAGDVPGFEQYLLPYASGTGECRLSGAKVTSVILDAGDDHVKDYIDYAKKSGFFDRLVYYPTDEPGSNPSTWDAFIAHAQALHAADPTARILITGTIDDAKNAGADGDVDVFVPIINDLEDREGSAHAGDHRPDYDAWLSGAPNRAVWSYQSCLSHGCGACGEATTDPYFTGWPNRVVDSSAVQDRAFPWHAFRLSFTGELYFQTTNQLVTAWDDDGQCAFSGSGDGTIFYPGKPSIIGGQTDIPIESFRMKMIREGMEDYEYLKLVAAKDPAKAKQIADTLFPHTYESAQPPEKLEAARDQLFALLDAPATSGSGGGGAGGAGGAGGGEMTGGSGGSGSGSAKGCGCAVPGTAAGEAPLVGLAVLAMAAGRRRRRGR